MAEKKETILYGIPASPGVAIGEVMVVSTFYTSFREPERKSIVSGQAETEIRRLTTALDITRQELLNMQRRLQNELDAKEASIFDAHLLIVDDQMLRKEAEQLVAGQNYSSDYAFYITVSRYVNAIAAMNDDYLRERADDIRDVACRVLSNLQGARGPVLDNLPGRRIVIAKDLTPSATATLDRQNVMAFAVGSGSQTSHTAILARSMNIPAVVGIKDIWERLEDGDMVIIDGYSGSIILHPSETTVKFYQQKESKDEKLFTDLAHESRLRPETLDGYCIQLAANVDNLEDVRNAKRFGAAGIGLYRTEYLFLRRDILPDEEEQFKTYRAMLTEMGGQAVTIRTIDVGGDKLADTLTSLSEPNPFLGLRAVRLCLREKRALLRTQLRAMLRAGAYGNLKLLFPMISCADEVCELKVMLEEIKAELKKEGIPFASSYEIGVMIEIPAAAIIAETLAEMVDFFSIGSNDLIQYTLAVDRGNDKVAYLYQPTHPAVLNLIMKTVAAAKKKNIWVGLCGEMAGNPVYLPLLLGMGIHELSMTPVALGAVRRVVRRLKMHEAEEVVHKAINSSTARDALKVCQDLIEQIDPDIFDLQGKNF